MNTNVKNVILGVEGACTPYHAVQIVINKLLNAGFKELSSCDEISNGSKYFVVRDDSAIIAFTVGKNYDKNKKCGMNIVVTHNDSPGFKIKQNPEISNYNNDSPITKFNVESYGSGIWHTWLDRKLGIAGRVIIKNGNVLEKSLINFDNDFVIPSLAIHMQRDINDGRKFNLQDEMMPIIGEKISLKEQILRTKNLEKECSVNDVLDYDLFLYSKEEVFYSGELFSCPRIDNLISTFSAIEAITSEEIENSSTINMVVGFDNEEIGSLTYAGARSTFLNETIDQILLKLACEEDVKEIYENSLIISLDGAHATHPNYKSVSDPTNKVFLNEGPVIKYHSSKKYSTDSIGASIIKYICGENGIKFQTFFNRSDMISGGTIGTLLFEKLGIRVVDMGLPQLAMHSIVETASTNDVEELYKFLKKFYVTKINNKNNKITFEI